MTGESLRAHLLEALSADAVRALADKYGIQERERKLDVFEFVVALIMAGGTHEGGRQYDVLRTYVENGAPRVVRGTFYAWFTERPAQAAHRVVADERSRSDNGNRSFCREFSAA